MMPGSERDIAAMGLFLPLMQDGRTLYFGDARLRAADHDNRESNLGLGVRRMLSDGWNLGAYAYVDRLRSANANTFDQVTLGAEALGPDWDLRGNVYSPQGSRVRDLGSSTVGGGPPTAAIAANVVQVTTPGSATVTSQELALEGYDAELGWRLPLFGLQDRRQLRAYIGEYRFADDGLEVAGPRARLELALAGLPGLGTNAQLFLGAQTEHDGVRGTQSFLSVTLRIPLGEQARSGPRLDEQELRMAAPVERDVDIVTETRTVTTASTPALVENAVETAAGQPLTVLSSTTTTGAQLPAAVAAAGANSTVILTGSFSTSASTALQSGQTVMGAGTLGVVTPTGHRATLTAPGAAITGNLGGTSHTVVMANSSTLTGVTVNTSDSSGSNALAVTASGISGARILDNTVNATETAAAGTAHGIDVGGGAGNITVSGNTVTARGGAIAIGVQVNSSSATVSGNSLSASGAASTSSQTQLVGANILPGSSGNTVAAGSCNVALAGSGGTVTYTNAAACGP